MTGQYRCGQYDRARDAACRCPGDLRVDHIDHRIACCIYGCAKAGIGREVGDEFGVVGAGGSHDGHPRHSSFSAASRAALLALCSLIVMTLPPATSASASSTCSLAYARSFCSSMTRSALRSSMTWCAASLAEGKSPRASHALIHACCSGERDHHAPKFSTEKFLVTSAGRRSFAALRQ